MKIYNKAVLPLGFKANGVACGLKRSKKLDLALFYSEIPAVASALFTTNSIQAAPIILDKIYLKCNKVFKAIIANSGNANCFTGRQGLYDALKITKITARLMDFRNTDVLVASTGVIGKRLDLTKIGKGLPGLVAGLSVNGINLAKKAIMTTDKLAKEITVKVNIGGVPVTICGIAKGAGMIAPDMATMLCFILTDANIAQGALDKALRSCVGRSFNCITVDGCMSTNDTVIALANSAAGNNRIDNHKFFAAFSQALGKVCLELAKSIVRDAEGATKFISISVKGASSYKEAKKVALNIANSLLFKTAMYGENPNFGRIVAAAGALSIGIKEKNLKIKVSSLKKKNIEVEVLLQRGSCSALVYTSDLSHEYIKINAEYN